MTLPTDPIQITFSNGSIPVPDDAITIETASGKLIWHREKIIFQGSESAFEPLRQAVVEFSACEAELRQLEAAIVPHEATADADVALAYEIRRSDRSQWPRLYRTMEQLARLRLRFAQLEPHLGLADPSLSPAGRKIFNRLLVKAKAEHRLEAISDRIEACEDLYEGAIDRITDQRNYNTGSLLEILIVVLLLMEVILLLAHGK
jgi:hypothetical protein